MRDAPALEDDCGGYSNWIELYFDLEFNGFVVELAIDLVTPVRVVAQRDWASRETRVNSGSRSTDRRLPHDSMPPRPPRSCAPRRAGCYLYSQENSPWRCKFARETPALVATGAVTDAKA
jgi:hypothetical protein